MEYELRIAKEDLAQVLPETSSPPSSNYALCRLLFIAIDLVGLLASTNCFQAVPCADACQHI